MLVDVYNSAEHIKTTIEAAAGGNQRHWELHGLIAPSGPRENDLEWGKTPTAGTDLVEWSLTRAGRDIQQERGGRGRQRAGGGRPPRGAESASRRPRASAANATMSSGSVRQRREPTAAEAVANHVKEMGHGGLEDSRKTNSHPLGN